MRCGLLRLRIVLAAMPGWFGGSPPDRVEANAAGTFSVISAGCYHACGVRTDLTLACWGNNYSGQATPPAGSGRRIDWGREMASRATVFRYDSLSVRSSGLRLPD